MKKFEEMYKATTLEELKSAYRKYAVKVHPDNGGNVKDMQDLNALYSKLFETLKTVHKNMKGETYNKPTDEVPSYFVDLIDKLIKLNVTIEIIGAFVWVSGDTKKVKEDLKKLGFKWHTAKLNWYLAPSWYHKTNKNKYSMDEVRHMYGVQYERQQTAEKAEEKAEAKPEKKAARPRKKSDSTSEKYYTQTALSM